MTADESVLREAAVARKRLAEVFGDVLPDAPAGDEGDDGAAEVRRDADLLRDVPPHHGG